MPELVHISVAGQSLPHEGAPLHVSGAANYTDDIPLPDNALHVALGMSTIAHGRITKARIAYGGMAAVPKRALHAEAALTGQLWSRASVEAALPALALDYAPLSDMRASAAYRMQVAQNLLLRFFVEHSGNPVPTRVAELEEH